MFKKIRVDLICDLIDPFINEFTCYYPRFLNKQIENRQIHILIL